MSDAPQPTLPTLIPALAVRDVKESLAWFERLGFQTTVALPGPDGQIVHAMVARGDAQIMFGPAQGTDIGGKGVVLYVNLSDISVDDYYQQARQAGAQIAQEPTDQFWGDRTFDVTHPDGYVFTFSQTVRQVSPEEMMEAMKQMAPAS